MSSNSLNLKQNDHQNCPSKYLLPPLNKDALNEWFPSQINRMCECGQQMWTRCNDPNSQYLSLYLDAL